MSARVTWTDLDEFRAELRNLPADLTGEGSAIVNEAGEGAKAEVLDAYRAHHSSGDLEAGVALVPAPKVGAFSTGVILKSTAKHAYIFENGSEARHYLTRKGVTHLTGKMPPAHLFGPIVARRRRAMYDALAALVRGKGFTVSGP